MHRISNGQARLLLLNRYELCGPPGTKLDADQLLSMIGRLGYVQLDSINTVARAHHLILFSRNQTYKPELLRQLLEDRRDLFEAWTHDASLIPSCFWPYWQPRFENDKTLILKRWRKWRSDPFEEQISQVLAFIQKNGLTMARDLKPAKKRDGSGWWDWHPSKTALEFLWRTGKLCVSKRQGFQKVYDLRKNVMPEVDPCPDREAMIDWACRNAFERMGFSTPTELGAFWDSVTRKEAQDWCEHNQSLLTPVEIETAEPGRYRQSLMLTSTLESFGGLIEPPKRLRILSPFDPLVRDRKRLATLFGFEYRIEVFVPEAKRQYGYYVFPILEGDSLIGRIDMRRDGEILKCSKIWFEPRIKFTIGRRKALDAELGRIAKFVSCTKVQTEKNFLQGH